MAEVPRDKAKGRRGRRRGGKGKRVYQKREPRWKTEVREIDTVTAQYVDLMSENVSEFNDLPLSTRTKDGLKNAGYLVPTEIQREAIPLALQGKDILGAAKTGSGKTLAFLIPVLEALWRERWGNMDGLGALVISPTRELAYQTFEVLRKVGHRHDLSAGLVIGGKDLKAEQERIRQTNIIVCTPGRLLQHMDETPNFDCSSVQILVLDEADRILDLGFEPTMNAVIENLPQDRQTLLFSATQTKSVHDLARLSLKDPEYVAVHEHSKTSTPYRLTQSYIVCELHEKLDVLFSFIRSHLTCKTIVFMSSCKQVKYTYEAFRRLRPGVPLMALYGKQKQLKRVSIYDDFCYKKAAVLFCTDIAARGLDFPAVHWVVQLDCPEDANTYIHRAGRTARYEKDGQALLVLVPSEEEEMLKELEAKRIPISRIRVNPKKTTSIQNKLQTFCAQVPEMKHWAQKSFICYLRSVHLQSNKNIFNVHKLPVSEYALSLGLSQPPRIRFLRKSTGKVKRSGRATQKSSVETEEEVETEQVFGANNDESDDDVLKVKRVIIPSEIPLEPLSFPSPNHLVKPTSPKGRRLQTKVEAAKKIIHKKIKVNTHIKFDEQGDVVNPEEEHVASSVDSDSEVDNSKLIAPIPIDYLPENGDQIGGINIKRARKELRKRDKIDRKCERLRIQAKHKERRRKRRRESQVMSGGEAVVLGGGEIEVEEEPLSDEGGEEEEKAPMAKKARRTSRRAVESSQLEQDEELVLHLLNT